MSFCAGGGGFCSFFESFARFLCAKRGKVGADRGSYSRQEQSIVLREGAVFLWRFHPLKVGLNWLRPGGAGRFISWGYRIFGSIKYLHCSVLGV